MTFNLYKYSQAQNYRYYTEIGHTFNPMDNLDGVYLYAIDEKLNFHKIEAEKSSLHEKWLGRRTLHMICMGRVDTVKKIASMAGGWAKDFSHTRQLLEEILRDNMGSDIKIHWF